MKPQRTDWRSGAGALSRDEDESGCEAQCHRDDTFHDQWQSYRTRQEPDFELIARYGYAEPSAHKVLVKVIDILGNDATKTLEG